MQYQVHLDMPLHSLYLALLFSVLSEFESKLEELISKELTLAGIELGSSSKYLYGKPDFVIQGERIAIFIHGCFWHRHRTCQRNGIPRTNSLQWAYRFNQTVNRDTTVRTQLLEDGWVSVIIWECSIKANITKCVHELSDFIQIYKSGTSRSFTFVI